MTPANEVPVESGTLAEFARQIVNGAAHYETNDVVQNTPVIHSDGIAPLFNELWRLP
jgi:hypothetical protein